MVEFGSVSNKTMVYIIGSIVVTIIVGITYYLTKFDAGSFGGPRRRSSLTSKEFDALYGSPKKTEKKSRGSRSSSMEGKRTSSVKTRHHRR